MKKIYLFFALLGAINFAHAQCDYIFPYNSITKCYGDDPTIDAGTNLNWYDTDTNLLHTGNTFNPMGMMMMEMSVGEYNYLIQAVGCTEISKLNLNVVETNPPIAEITTYIIRNNITPTLIVTTGNPDKRTSFRWYNAFGIQIAEGEYIFVPATDETNTYYVSEFDEFTWCESRRVA
ncbi:MAG: hypothetical protein IPO21_18200 [Bacteroidales bacterium]|nr:hypothetical protein [Bacteroidales bacterium]